MLLAPLPALVVGVLLMRRSGVSPAIWGQQLGAGVTLAGIVAIWRAGRRSSSQRRPWAASFVGSASVFLLISTLFHPGVEGVRRWVSLGPLQLHAAFIALPVLIIVLGQAVRRDAFRSSPWVLPCALAVAAGVLVLQPDASQAIAFGVAMTIILLQKSPARRSHWLATAIVLGGALVALSRPDPLDAVPHVEGIVWLAADAGAGWLAAAVVALVLLPTPFVVNAVRARGRRDVSVGVAAYFATVIIASLLAPYPVPLLGFGLSPILGYFAALAWMIRRDAWQPERYSSNVDDAEA
jgi:cell division protein FtsW (lipid II flippase)